MGLPAVDEALLQMQGVVVHSGKAPICFRQPRLIVVTLGHFLCLLKERHRTFQLEDIFTLKHGQSIKRNALHLWIMHPTGRLKHGLIGSLRGFGIIVDIVETIEVSLTETITCQRVIITMPSY